MMAFGFLILLVVGAVLLLPLLSGKGGDILNLGNNRQPTARQTLDERLARGAIDQDEYEAIRATLER